MRKLSKKMKSAHEAIDRTKFYDLPEALKILKDLAQSRNFDQTVELAMNLNADPRHSDQNVRGMVTLPHGTGTSVRVAVFAKGDKAEEAKKAGADIVGAEDLMEEIQKGNMDFERCIATPDMMGLVGRVGKLLGPKGLMPNPKLGTVTPDVKKAVEDAKGGAIEYRAEKAGIVHAGVGKISFDQKKLEENIRFFFDTVQKARPSGVKGTYVKKVTITTSMGPGLKLDVSALIEAPDVAKAA